MSEVIKYKIDSILGGISPWFYDASKGSYLMSLGIDPDLPVSVYSYVSRLGGAISPSTYNTFSSSLINDTVLELINVPQNELTYAVMRSGKIICYNSGLTTASETSVGTVLGYGLNFASALPFALGGAAEYNNYIYLFGTGLALKYKTQTGNFTVGLTVTGGTSHATGVVTKDTDNGATGTLVLKTVSGVFQNGEALTDTNTGAALVDGVLFASGADVTRYGPLNGTPAFTENWWTGLSLDPLTQVTYPQVYGAYTPNHWAHYHAPDDTLYFCDYSSTDGRGQIHKIVTKAGLISSISYPGVDDDGSAFSVLLLPLGIFPIDIEDYGADLAVATTRTTSNTVIQGKAEIYFWDTFSDTYYNVVKLPDTFATALLNNDGELYIFSGSSGGGSRLSYYSGGRSTTQLCFIEESHPPMQGAVGSYGDRILFGGNTELPETASCVYSWGSKDTRLKSVLHNVVRTRAGASVPLTSAIRFVQQASGTYPRMIVAWSNTASWGIDKLSSPSALNSVFQSPVFQVGAKFVIREIKIPLGSAVSLADSIVPTVVVDDMQGNVFTLDTIGGQNFFGKKKAIYKNPKMDDTNPITGDHNFVLQLKWTGAYATSVVFPIEITVEVFYDEPTR